MLKPRQITASHAELFLERYEWLLRRALGLTSGDREQAEDLVHDVYVHFVLNRLHLESIVNNIEGYLFTMLRNMHLSEARRASRLRGACISLTDLSLTDYDSIENGLLAIRETLERTQAQFQVQVQQDLRRICEYAVLRKATSKAAGVLILRFFHGYYPNEIAQILRTTRGAVDFLMRSARTEARAYINDPHSFGTIAIQSTGKARFLTSIAASTEDFINELRAAILDSNRNECPPVASLLEPYRADEPEALDCSTLAHIVSCRDCLDRVNTELGLSLLASRYPTDTLAKDTGKKGGPGGPTDGGAGGTGPTGELALRSRGRLKETIEHKPHELRIAVNGYVLGSHNVSSELFKHTLSVNLEEKIGFVEVFSEREVRLLFSVVEPPPDGPVEHRQRVVLSEGRTLELSLDFTEPWPTLQVTYYDPTYKTAEQPASSFDEALSPSLRQQESTQSDERGRFALVLSRLWQFIRNWNLWFRPSTVTALFALVLVGVLLLTLWRRVPPAILSAPELLQRSAVADEATAAKTDTILHRTVNLEERLVDCRLPIADCRLSSSASSPTGKLIARHRIEVWQSAEKGITARRLYNEKGQLIAGDWRRSDGVQTLYQHGKPPQLQTPNPPSAIGNRELWQLSPSAKEFTSLIGDTATTRVEERSDTYIISAESAKSVDSSARVSTGSGPGSPSGQPAWGGGSDRLVTTSTPSAANSSLRTFAKTFASFALKSELLKAILVLNRADLHPIEQTLLITQGNETREYRFIETAFERKPASDVAPAVFEPEPELLSSTKPETLNLKRETVSPLPLSPLPLAASADLEVEVVQRLDQAGVFLGEQLSLTRTSQGTLLLQGVVSTELRKSEIMRSLGPVSKDPAVRVEIETVAEAQKRQSRSADGPITIQGVEVTQGAIPVEAELRNYFSTKRGLSPELADQEVRRFSTRIFNRSIQARLQALALKQIVERFSAADLQTMNPEARVKWRALVSEHARAFRRETGILRQELEPIFPALSSEPANIEITNVADLVSAGKRLFELASASDEALRQSFSVSSENSRAAPIKTEGFWRALSNAENLAAKIGAVARP